MHGVMRGYLGFRWFLNGAETFHKVIVSCRIFALLQCAIVCDGMSPNVMFSNGSEHVSEDMTKHAIWMSGNVKKRQANCDIGAFQRISDVPPLSKPYVFLGFGAHGQFTVTTLSRFGIRV